MRRSPALAAVAPLAAVLLSACGPTGTPAAAPATTAAAPAASTAGAAASPSAAPAAAGGKVTPEQICGMMTVAKAAEISGFAVKTATPSLSGDVAVCTYEEAGGVGKLITEWQPNAKTMFDMTKSQGERVAGLGKEAVYFTSSGQLTVRLTDVDLFHCYVLDVRMHHNNPKAGAIEVAKLVTPQLPSA
ncbi:hypothetical protein [Hamadaea tsunoensis]|uniref:hypothetical protein n=1 Tax=Hamadaea tsunoensis TaxID=53368 RepID=UPI0012FA5DA6|nr:hypothetical protein [Hamadaea tsunoensis]